MNTERLGRRARLGRTARLGRRARPGRTAQPGRTARLGRTARPGRTRTLRRRALIAAPTLAALLATASPALANLKQEYEPFANCPLGTPGVSACVVGHTTSGEFVIGDKTVPITQPITLQGGLAATKSGCCELVAPTNGETISKAPQPVPGGLVGAELGDLTEVTATSELAGVATVDPGALFVAKGVGVSLPLKVKLENPVLGSACYVGSNSEPIALQLTTGTTDPPAPNKPISGSHGTIVVRGEGEIGAFENSSLVDNAFAAPGANGCGGLLSPVVDTAVDGELGVPDEGGHNTAILDGSLEQATASAVSAVLPLPELGRCEKAEGVVEGKKTVFHGLYEDAGCVEESEIPFEGEPPTGKYDWVAGPGPDRKFTGTTAALTLQTVGGAKVACTAGHSAGEYTGAKTESVSMTLTGCKTAGKGAGKGVSCQSSASAAGEIDSSPLAGELEFIDESEPAKPVVGWDLKPAASGSLASFECAGATASVTGSVIAPVAAVDKMTTALKLRFKATAGVQDPEGFEGGPKDTLTFTASGAAEQAGLTATDAVVDEEALEVKGGIVLG